MGHQSGRCTRTDAYTSGGTGSWGAKGTRGLHSSLRLKRIARARLCLDHAQPCVAASAAVRIGDNVIVRRRAVGAALALVMVLLRPTLALVLQCLGCRCPQRVRRRGTGPVVRDVKGRRRLVRGDKLGDNLLLLVVDLVPPLLHGGREGLLQLRRLFRHCVQVRAAEHEELTHLDRLDTRRTPRVLDQRDLAEERAGPQRRVQALLFLLLDAGRAVLVRDLDAVDVTRWNEHVDGAVHENVHFFSRLAGGDDVLPLLRVAHLELSRKRENDVEAAVATGARRTWSVGARAADATLVLVRLRKVGEERDLPQQLGAQVVLDLRLHHPRELLDHVAEPLLRHRVEHRREVRDHLALQREGDLVVPQHGAHHTAHAVLLLLQHVLAREHARHDGR
mmetsp:Transcript_26282/g.81187  ORF Transcript_26282/g.81187 Transcript_26282/m.81187 type:complete len:392 (+) Transcript_26282:2-1177(+)